MIPLSEEANFILLEFFLVDPLSQTPMVHPKKKEKKQGALQKELKILIHDYEELETNIDLAPYKEALQFLRKVRGKELYRQFIDDLLRPYETTNSSSD